MKRSIVGRNCAEPCCENTACNCDGERDNDQRRRDRKCDPHTGSNSFGMRCCHVARRRCEREHSAHDGCTADESEIARQVELACM